MLAVVVFMLDTFIVAELAYLNAFFHDVPGVRGVAGHQPGRQRTYIGAVPVGLNTFHHHGHIFFLQAERSTGFAGGNALYQYMFQVISSFGFHHSGI
jgi:hypothetical protein